MNKVVLHVERGCQPVPTNIFAIKTKRRLVNCSCGQKFYATGIDIANLVL